MKRNILICLFALLTSATFAVGTNSTPEQTEANYTKAIEGRTIAQYRALNAWHDANDAKLKAAKADTNAVAQIQLSLKAIHDQFLSKLAENLTPEQVDAVKDKMTYGKVQFTFKGYMVEYPNLPEAQQQKVLELLKEARELAMDGGSSEEKTAIFNKYKGKINNYLSKEGFHPASKKPKATTPAQQ
jgi:hypothetical protein